MVHGTHNVKYFFHFTLLGKFYQVGGSIKQKF